MKGIVFAGIGVVLFSEVVFAGPEREGTAFFENYTAEEYDAHDRNEAVVCGREGYVYFANYEGVLCYDGQGWQLLTTPGISRVTSLFMDSQGKVYAGGFNVAGQVERKENGGLVFRAYLNDGDKEVKRIGEVRCIVEYGGQTVFVAEQGVVWVKEDSVRVEMTEEKLTGGFYVSGRFWIRTEQGGLREWREDGWQECRERELQELPGTIVRELAGRGWLAGTDNGLFFRVKEGTEWRRVKGIPEDARITDVAVTGDTLVVVATATYGVYWLDKQLRECGRADEERGLCSNVVNGVSVDEKGSLWLATGKGIARVSLGSMYSRFTEREGLAGEVLTIGKEGGDLYVGTYRGVFYKSQQSGRFAKLEGINQACWQLKTDAEGRLWAATGSGLFEVKGRKAVKRHAYFTMGVTVEEDGKCLYSGEQDAVYVYRRNKEGVYTDRRMFAALGQVNELLIGEDGKVWMATIFGEVYLQDTAGRETVELKGLENRLGNRITWVRGQMMVMAQDGFYMSVGGDSVRKVDRETGFWPSEIWAESCVEDERGRVWLTRADGKGIWVGSEQGIAEECRRRLKAVERYNVRVVYEEEEVVWLGGSFGLICLDLKKNDPALEQTPAVYVRQVIEGGVSGRNWRFVFASDAPGMVDAVSYSFRLQGLEKEWSNWSEEQVKEYVRLPYGRFCFEVRARDVFGKVSQPVKYWFRVPAPFYWKWYAWLFYAGLLTVLVGGVVRWRIRRLSEANQRLEQMVERRTEEIRLQRDEITRKSRQLEQTLEQLSKAQDDLIRQEKMATVGKLTQGLVDRILNPLNYIGNFAVLARGLATEAGKVLKAKAEKIPEELEADMQEIMEMLSGNLTKIVEHGESTARILKAMEEILKERKCMPAVLRMNELCRRCMDRLKEWFSREMKERAIDVVFREWPGDVEVMADERQLEKVFMSVLGNGMYGLLKKREKEVFDPELVLQVKVENGEVIVVIQDNGIGIEEAVLDKVFDPFFTTRSTAEAAGVGLYLCREVILNHKGRISIRSQQGEWTEVIICLGISEDLAGLEKEAV